MAWVVMASAGCTLGPEYVRNAPDLPQEFSEAGKQGENVANLSFWDFFRNPDLQELIRIGLSENRNLAQAMARIEAARAQLGFVRSDQFPALNVTGNAARVNPSDALKELSGMPFNDFALGTQLTFEVDLWGKFRRATEAERANLLSSEFGYRAVVLSLVSEIASTYFLLIDLDNRYAIADRTVANRKYATDLIRSRFKGGLVPELDVHQAEIEEGDAMAVRASLQRGREQTENAINILLGRTPRSIPRNVALNRGLLVADIPVGFPAELLERRPDVIAAEQFTRAEYSRIGVAEAQRLPAVSLLGNIGLESSDTRHFLESKAFTWDFGGSLLGPLIDFGRSRSRVEIAQAQAEEATAAYQQSVLVAVREVEDALSAIRTYQDENKAREMQLKAASNAIKLSWARYNDGVTSFLEVLDVERSLFTAELDASETFQLYLNSIVRLYAALGGGWANSLENGQALSCSTVLKQNNQD